MPATNPNESSDESGTADQATGVPLLSTWRAIYIVVTIIFVFWVGLLAILSRAFQ
jgi:hypothetical protein